ncbi:hypothetical protein KUCAC02_034488, partial [Chaenocephalus aceratus]
NVFIFLIVRLCFCFASTRLSLPVLRQRRCPSRCLSGNPVIEGVFLHVVGPGGRRHAAIKDGVPLKAEGHELHLKDFILQESSNRITMSKKSGGEILKRGGG